VSFPASPLFGVRFAPSAYTFFTNCCYQYKFCTYKVISMFSRKTPSKTASKVDPEEARLAEEEKLNAIFNQYVDVDEDTEALSLEGIAKLCSEVDIDAGSDVRGLVLMWRLGAVSKPGTITRKEFIDGMRRFRVSSIKDLSSKVPSLDLGFLERAEFRGFFVLKYFYLMYICGFKYVGFVF
jgi:hypothetical protein